MSYIIRYKEDIVYQTFDVLLPYIIFLIASSYVILDQRDDISNSINILQDLQIQNLVTKRNIREYLCKM